MKKFKKKSVVIEAEQWLGTEKQKERLLEKGIIMVIPSQDGSCLIPTLEGNMTCSVNDYIIKGVKGEYYPCKPDIFELTYDEFVAKKVAEVKPVKAVKSDVIVGEAVPVVEA